MADTATGSGCDYQRFPTFIIFIIIINTTTTVVIVVVAVVVGGVGGVEIAVGVRLVGPVATYLLLEGHLRTDGRVYNDTVIVVGQTHRFRCRTMDDRD